MDKRGSSAKSFLDVGDQLQLGGRHRRTSSQNQSSTSSNPNRTPSFISSRGSSSSSEDSLSIGDEPISSPRDQTDPPKIEPVTRDLSTAQKIRAFRQKVGTVEDLWIVADNLNFVSDDEISDISEIWSQYGEELEPDKGGKLHKWNPHRKNVSMKLSNRERGLIEDTSKRKRKRVRKKDPKKIIPGMSFVPIGAQGAGDQRQGVYFLDFSTHFKSCMKRAREDFEHKRRIGHVQAPHRSILGSISARTRPNSSNEVFMRKFGITKLSTNSQETSNPLVSTTKSEDYSSDDDIFGEDPNESNWAEHSLFKSGTLISPLSFSTLSGLQGKVQTMPEDSKLGQIPQRRKSSVTRAKIEAQKISASKEGGLGPRWPKGMWDSMDSYWRMIMAPGKFVITPNNYNERFDYQFRQCEEKISNEELEKIRTKVKRWLSENNQFFAL